MAYKDTILADAPLVYCQFEEASGAPVNQGSLSTGITATSLSITRVTGKDGFAWQFDGNDTFSLNSSTTYLNDKTWTIEAWVKVPTTWTAATYGTIFRRSSGSQHVIFRVRGNVGTNSYKLEGYVAGSGGTSNPISAKTLNDNQWHHVALVNDGTSCILYIDGASDATDSTYIGSSMSITNTAWVGSNANTDEYFNGTMDEFALYGNALTSTQVNNHYQALNGVSVNAAGVTAMAVSVAMPTIDPKTNVSYATDDSFTMASPNGGINNGTSTQLNLSTSQTPFIKFKLQPKPAGQEVQSAILKLRDNGAQTFAGSQSVTINYVSADWAEANINGNNAPAYTTYKTFTYTFAANVASTTTVDITDLYNEWLAGSRQNYGIALTTSGGGTLSFFSSENSDYVNSPKVEVAFAVPSVNKTVTAGVSTLAVAAPAATWSAEGNVSVTATALAASAVMPSGAVVTVAVSRAVEAALASVDMPLVTVQADAIPDAVIAVSPLEAIIYFIDGDVVISVDASAGASAFAFDVDMLDGSITNQTDKNINVAPMIMSSKVVGIYNKLTDPWYNYVLSGTGGFHDGMYEHDGWYRFEEQTGDIVVGEAGTKNATFFGSPTHIDGAKVGRKAISLDGIDDGIAMPLFGDYNGNLSVPVEIDAGWSMEFVMRTTATSGTIISNELGQRSLEVTENGMRLATWDDADNSSGVDIREYFLNIDTKVNDGNWHQIFVMEYGALGLIVMVDGKTIFNRKNGLPARFAMPSPPKFIGIKPASFVNTGTNQSGSTILPIPRRPLRADFADIIVRNGEAFGEDEARRSFYIYNDHTIVDSGTVGDAGTVSMPQGAFAKGNQKKMLLITGIAATKNRFTGERTGQFSSPWSGMAAYNDSRAFEHNGYKVYPVNAYSPQAGLSAPGIVTDTGESGYYDNETGDVRYIDINKDLAVDVTTFDVIHVLNWPLTNWNPNDEMAADEIPYTASNEQSMNEFKYDHARDAFRDSILGAVNKGVGLWIAEAQMAVDFGFAKEFDVHNVITSPDDYDEYLDHAFYAHGPADTNYDGVTVNGQGFVNGSYRQANGERRRKIVSTAPNFSEFETYYVGERIYWEGVDRLAAHATAYAHNLVHLNGLGVGAEMVMADRGGLVYSLRPQGIVGQVIAKEQAQIPTVNGVIDNPYKNNATTVLVERGTIVNGQAIGGRVFIELMDNDVFEPAMRHTTLAKTMVNGTETDNAYRSNWDFDSRRNRETFYWQSYQFMQKNTIVVTDQIGLVDGTNVPAEILPVVGMNQRGLTWLGVESEVDDGQANVYVAAIEASATMASPSTTTVRNANIGATTMTAKVELRKPVGNYDPDATIFADAMALTAVLGGYQRVVVVAPIDLTVEMGNSAVRGEGEDIVFFLRDDTITLYLGEDD